MNEFPSVQVSTIPRYVKVLKVDKKKSNASNQKSQISEARNNSVASVLTHSRLSKTKVFPLDHVQSKQFRSISSISLKKETLLHNYSHSMDRVDIKPTANSFNKKINGLNKLAIGLGIFIAVCALAGLAIGLYFIISNNTKTNSITATTATTSTLSACTQSLCWETSGTTALGTGSSGSNSDQFNNPYHLVIDSSGSFYVADYSNHRIQKFTASSLIGITVAGQGNANSGATAYYLNEPAYVLLDSSGNLYVSDSQNHRVQYFASGSMTGITIAGTGTLGASLNQLDAPHGLALDSSTGTLYISDTYNHRVISYSSGAGSGTVVAGGNGAGSLNTQLNTPMGLYLDVSSNSLYIANKNSHNIVHWVINASTWTLIAGAGNGQPGFTSVMLYYPTDLTFDYMGNLYVADSGNHRIQHFLSGEFNGTTIAGITGVYARAANTLDGPQSVTLDSNLNLYVVDTGNSRIQTFQRY